MSPDDEKKADYLNSLYKKNVMFILQCNIFYSLIYKIKHFNK